MSKVRPPSCGKSLRSLKDIMISLSKNNNQQWPIKAADEIQIIPLHKIAKVVFGSYLISIYLLSFYLNFNDCEKTSLPEWVYNFLSEVSSFFTFFDRHQHYAQRLKCFKLVFSYAFILFFPVLLIVNLYGYTHYLSVARRKKSDNKRLYLIEAPFFSVAVVIFVFRRL